MAGAAAIGAILLVVSYHTSGTPPDTLDDTTVIMNPYPSLVACINDLKAVPPFRQ